MIEEFAISNKEIIQLINYCTLGVAGYRYMNVFLSSL